MGKSPPQPTEGEAGSALPTTVYTVSPETWASEVADLMRSRDIGDVVVVRDGKPVGIVTDRDLIVKVMAAGSDPRAVQIRTIMSEPLVTVSAKEEVGTAIGLMAAHGIRRIPIVDESGSLVSILTLDDVLQHDLAGSSELTGIIRQQLRPGGKDKPLPPAAPPSRAVEPGRLNLSQPVTAVHRQTVIRSAPHVRRTRLDFVRAWLFWNRDWLQFTGLLVLLIALAAALTHYVGPKQIRERLVPMPHYEPKDEERQLYLEYLRMKKEEESR